MNMIYKVLGLREFENNPPVLVDIGASGAPPRQWRKIAFASIYVGFDADLRELDSTIKAKGQFKKSYILNNIVSDTKGTHKFYYTRSPYCSSTLPPLSEDLQDWSFTHLFEVVETAETEAITLTDVLRELSLDYVDWFKSDSQGTDLRLFQSLGDQILRRVIVAELEPGIMDAYAGEDKMHRVMAFMEGYPFWISDLKIKGPQRVRYQTLKDHFGRMEQRFLPYLLRSSAFWGEMSYVNTFRDKEMLTRRNLLLGWVFSTLKGQHGFSMELAQAGFSFFSDSVFQDLLKDSVLSIRKNHWKAPFRLARRIFEKVLA